MLTLFFDSKSTCFCLGLLLEFIVSEISTGKSLFVFFLFLLNLNLDLFNWSFNFLLLFLLAFNDGLLFFLVLFTGLSGSGSVAALP